MASMMFSKNKKKVAPQAKATVSAGKPKEDRVRTTTKTTVTDPGKKGSMYIEEGTVQRNKNKGVSFVPKTEQKTIENNKKQIVDPKSNKTESSSQASLRKASLDSHKGVDLSKRYKEGDMITYDTKKGKQVAGRVKKNPDTPPEIKRETVKEYKAEKNYSVGKTGGKMMGNTYVGGRYKVDPKKSKYIEEKDLSKGSTQKEGYVVENEAKQKDLNKTSSKMNKKEVKKSGSKMMKLSKYKK